MWAGLPQISSVTHQGNDWRPPLPDVFADTCRLVLPLHERNIFTTPRGSWALLPSRQALLTLADKQRFADFVAASGLRTFAPRTYAPGAEIFPLILKRTNLSATYGVALIRSRAELTQRLGEAPWLGHPVILQEYVAAMSDGVTHAVCVEGRFAWHCSYSYRTQPGELLKPRVAVPAPDQLREVDLAILGRFTRAVSFNGPVSFDYRRRADGRLAVLEINPRFGGSLLRRQDRSDLRAAIDTIIANARWYG